MTAPATRAVMSALEAAGGEGVARFVGGCVRDSLLGLDHAGMDVDIATVLTPPEVTSAIERAGLKAAPTGIAHGTVTAVARDGEGVARPFEVTTLRRDVETDGRRAVVAFTTDWAEDAARRDFRLNALYLAADGTLFDPTGGGIADAQAGRIVFVGDATQRIREDYLRILRFFRFFAWYGRGAPDAEALAACAALKVGVERLSGERIAREFLKLLAAPDPRPALQLMAGAGVLEVLLPGACGSARLQGLVTLDVQDGRAPDPVLRLAALLPPGRPEAEGALTRLRLANAVRDRVLATCLDGVTVETSMRPSDARRAVHVLGGRAVADRLRLARAEAPDADAGPWRALERIAETWTPPPFPIGGGEIAAAGGLQGPAVGAMRRRLEAWWTAGDFRAGKGEALAQMQALLAQDRRGP